MLRSFLLQSLVITSLALVFAASSGFGQRQIFFKESTFDEFAYPNGTYDEAHKELIESKAHAQFPNARIFMISSYVTLDEPRTVVSHYSNLCGQRFTKEGDLFTYIFSEIDGTPATRIEIYPMKVSRIHRAFWPTRIDLYIIRYPLTVKPLDDLDHSAEELKERVGRFYYEGELREDVSKLDMEELGPDAEVYVIDTKDSFDQVHRHFRRRYGAFRVRLASDGNLLTRDFEIDVSHALGPEDRDKDLYVYVEENPIVIDRIGNSQVYRGHVFIKYVFWEKDEDELYQ